MVVCIRVRAPRRDWVLFRSIVSQTNGVHVVSSEDIMFSQTGRTNRKWTAVSFTLRDKYGLSRRRWCSAPIIPAVSASSFQHRKSFDSSRSERETVRATVFPPLLFPPSLPPSEYYSIVMRRNIRSLMKRNGNDFFLPSFLKEIRFVSEWNLFLVMRGDESVANMNIFRRFFFTRKEKKNRREKQEDDYLLKFSFQ